MIFQSSLGLGLLFGSMTSSFDTDEAIVSYFDSDWDAYPTTRRSITSYGIYLGLSLISYQTKMQSTVLRSSIEAAYRAFSSKTCEVT